MLNVTEKEDLALKKYRGFLEVFSAITDEEWAFYKSLVELQNYSKGQVFLKAGDPGHKFSFIISGLFKKSFVTLEGKEFITSFSQEGQWLADYASLIKRTEAKLDITAIEDAVLLTINDPEARVEMAKKSTVWEKVGRVIAELGYIEKSEREWDFLCLDARERYEKFCEEKDLADRISKMDLACYLGISNVSLSRIINSRS